MAVSVKWAILSILMAAYLKSLTSDNKTLPSLRHNPSPLYTPQFYPNGTFVTLPMGTMHYWLFGPPDGNRVVLIHGISTGAASYDSLARYLAERGHHVLVFDLWGRGFSDAPQAKYDESLYTTQVALLLQKVGWNKADIVGTSLGGAIATSFTAFYPEMVNRLVLIAPAGLMPTNDLPWTGKLIKLPMAGRLVLHPWTRALSVPAVIRFFRSSRRNRVEGDLSTKLSQIAFYQFAHHPGFLRAFLSTVIDYPLTDLHERFQQVGAQIGHGKVLVLWGDQDKTVPFRLSKRLVEYIPQAELVVYEGGGHDILIAVADQVNQKIHSYLAH